MVPQMLLGETISSKFKALYTLKILKFNFNLQKAKKRRTQYHNPQSIKGG